MKAQPRTTDWAAVAASAPLDAQASAVRDGSGEIYDDRPAPGFEHVLRWAAPPPLKSARAVSGAGLDQLRANVGRRVGRLVILGILAGGSENQKAAWVCRCDCGYYEARKLKALNALGEAGACSHCLQTARLQAIARKPSTQTSRRRAARLLDRMSASSRVL